MSGGRVATRIGGGVRRWTLFLLILLTTLAGTVTLAAILQDQGLVFLELVLLLLFPVLFGWISMAFWTAAAGFAVLLVRGSPGEPRGVGRTVPVDGDETRAALVMPIYNEDTDGVFARVRAMYESLSAHPAAHRFDIFVLSDSTDPQRWIAEEMAWKALCDAVGGYGRIFYRHRARNLGRKSGNLADFCERWGSRYDYMIVLDADSVMAAETLAEMVRLMDVNPQVGLIQAPPVPVGQRTLFARIQQFACSVYGPIYSTGLAFWQLGEGNYWGHNAIIRTRAFIGHCGLPALPGNAPLGGEIMSHDFVEAALLRRAGWEVWMLPRLVESYEETPPTLIDHAIRDRRWCQGNLQHFRLIFAAGLNPVSRIHLAMGVMSYICSPLWLLFLVIAGFEALRQTQNEPTYFLGDSLFPAWPASYAVEASALLIVTLSLLYLPKLFALFLLALDRRARVAHGGFGRVALGVFLESVFSVLLAPIMMLFQTRFVIANLLGNAVGWSPQRRKAGRVAIGDLVSALGWQVVIAVAVGFVAWRYVPQFFPWLVPVLLGPFFAIGITIATGSEKVGDWCRSRRLFLIPAETRPTPILRRLAEIEALAPHGRSSGGDLIGRVIEDPYVNALHVAMLPEERRLRSERIYLDALVERYREGGLSALTADEIKGLLNDAESMAKLHAVAWELDDVPDTMLEGAGGGRPAA